MWDAAACFSHNEYRSDSIVNETFGALKSSGVQAVGNSLAQTSSPWIVRSFSNQPQEAPPVVQPLNGSRGPLGNYAHYL